MEQVEADVAYISTHTSLAGGDGVCRKQCRQRNQFQPTPPSREATIGPFFYTRITRISTHTSLAGGDVSLICRSSTWDTISTHTSLAGGDYDNADEPMMYVISTHTSLAGGDRFYFSS